jgi:hypothetical protein
MQVDKNIRKYAVLHNIPTNMKEMPVAMLMLQLWRLLLLSVYIARNRTCSSIKVVAILMTVTTDVSVPSVPNSVCR